MLESFWGYTIDFGANIEEDKAAWYGYFITWRQMSSDVSPRDSPPLNI